MQRRTKLAIAGVAVAVAAGGTGIGVAMSGDDPEVPIEGDARRRAVTAALDHLGEGRVTDTEAGDEEGAYEVEVTLDDGSQVDVHLDSDFEVTGTEGDQDGPEDEDGDEDGDD